jgi:hypothetical protein
MSRVQIPVKARVMHLIFLINSNILTGIYSLKLTLEMEYQNLMHINKRTDTKPWLIYLNHTLLLIVLMHFNTSSPKLTVLTNHTTRPRLNASLSTIRMFGSFSLLSVFVGHKRVLIGANLTKKRLKKIKILFEFEFVKLVVAVFY